MGLQQPQQQLKLQHQLTLRLQSVPWMEVFEVQDAAKVEDVAKKLDCPDSGKNIVIINVNNNVNGNTIVVNDHVKVDHDGPKPPHPPTPPPKLHPPMKALTINNNPVECGVCEYVGLALL